MRTVPVSFTVTDGPTFGMFIAPNGESIAPTTTDPPGNRAADISPRVSGK